MLLIHELIFMEILFGQDLLAVSGQHPESCVQLGPPRCASKEIKQLWLWQRWTEEAIGYLFPSIDGKILVCLSWQPGLLRSDHAFSIFPVCSITWHCLAEVRKKSSCQKPVPAKSEDFCLSPMLCS